MNIALKITENYIADDCPGWIPAHIGQRWDKNPYAYQTEEELMPAGGLHGQMIGYVMEILRDYLEKHNLMLLPDTFMIYRDENGIRQRIAPDLLLTHFRFPPQSAYDLEIEPLPLCIVEITSPKSRLKDMRNKLIFYTGLGISSYLVIDAITPGSKLHENIELHFWRKSRGEICQIHPDTEGFLILPEMTIKVRAEGQKLIFADRAAGQILRNIGELKTALTKEQERAERLAAKLKELGISVE